MKLFYNDFAAKLSVYDPLERPIPDEEEDQAIKRNELLDIIMEMPMIPNSQI